MKLILTGATGYVGEGVLLELLRSPQVDKVLSVMAHSMLVCTRDGYTRPTIDPIDIQRLAKRIISL